MFFLKTIDRDYYIEKLIEREKQNKNIVVIEVDKGYVLPRIHNLPKGYDYTIIDWDILKEISDEEFAKLVKDIIIEEQGV